MNTVTSILAAPHLLASARHAAERAARLAREHQATLTVMHVILGGALQELRGRLGTGNGAAACIEDESARTLQPGR